MADGATERLPKRPKLMRRRSSITLAQQRTGRVVAGIAGPGEPLMNADDSVAAAREMPQLVTLCGIEAEKQDIDFSHRGLDEGDAKLLAFDLSRNHAIKTMR